MRFILNERMNVFFAEIGRENQYYNTYFYRLCILISQKRPDDACYSTIGFPAQFQKNYVLFRRHAFRFMQIVQVYLCWGFFFPTQEFVFDIQIMLVVLFRLWPFKTNFHHLKVFKLKYSFCLFKFSKS